MTKLSLSLSKANRLSQLSCLNKSVKSQQMLSNLVSSFKAGVASISRTQASYMSPEARPCGRQFLRV